MTTVEILRAAKTLIEDQAHWCKDTQAKGRNGRPVDPLSRAAVSFCAVGALVKTSWKNKVISEEAVDILHRAAAPLRSAGDLNDTRGHAAVMKMYDRAIKLAEKGD